MFKIGNVQIKNPICLAPMAGYTNSVYRMIAKEMGVGLVYSEMISAKGLIYDNDRTNEMLFINPQEHPISIQLFGGEIDELVHAAKIIDQKTNADIIDFNMGCPVKKVLKSNAGSKLLLDSDHIYNIVEAVVKAVNKPVTVKIRAGWDHSNINCIEVAQKIEKAGASAIAIHGRTKSDLYRGKVDLDYIKMVKDNVSIPVIGNGDVKSIQDAVLMKQYTGVDGIMVGRGSFGNPWLLRDLVDYFTNQPLKTPPTPREKIEMLIKHFEELVTLKGEKLAVLEMRSLASWYSKGFSNSKEFRQKLVAINNQKDFLKAINELYLES